MSWDREAAAACNYVERNEGRDLIKKTKEPPSPNPAGGTEQQENGGQLALSPGLRWGPDAGSGTFRLSHSPFPGIHSWSLVTKPHVFSPKEADGGLLLRLLPAAGRKAGLCSQPECMCLASGIWGPRDAQLEESHPAQASRKTPLSVPAACRSQAFVLFQSLPHCLSFGSGNYPHFFSICVFALRSLLWLKAISAGFCHLQPRKTVYDNPVISYTNIKTPQGFSARASWVSVVTKDLCSLLEHSN